MNGYKVTTSRWKTLEDHLKRIFSVTDLDNNGTIEYEEFLAVSVQNRYQCTQVNTIYRPSMIQIIH